MINEWKMNSIQKSYKCNTFKFLWHIYQVTLDACLMPSRTISLLKFVFFHKIDESRQTDVIYMKYMTTMDIPMSNLAPSSNRFYKLRFWDCEIIFTSSLAKASKDVIFKTTCIFKSIELFLNFVIFFN